MTDIQRPTYERLRHADHLADDGSATQDKPYIRAQRLGTPWDRYCRDRDGNGKLLTDEQMTLTRAQIAAGNDFIDKHERSRWGGANVSRFEASVSGSFNGPPTHALDAMKGRTRLEQRLSPRYLLSLVECVLLDGHSAETWAGATGRKANSGIHYLRLALDQMGEE